MTLRAICHHCAHAFDLSRLVTSDPADADRCPRCRRHLGPSGLGHTAAWIERHLRGLVNAVDDLTDRPGSFTLDALGLRAEVLAALDRLDEPPRLDASSRSVPAVRTGHRTTEGLPVHPSR